ncbi:class I fructose-bisphosphate aldolase [Halorubrum lacusprofundi]|uniref:fructose-bisphosphate aldolase n=1 Tax=Halorubrum lacusprofundi (strain ATCC 49239 / DSM 5036 / JCM 8891 / ACAM 34) TaxID=416348 RepID=B9LT62_HALLT|nr:aldolase [Halorubrum lacusprofundi]ACM58034.1 deoxyribose-phosphate aldolase/phospho-2-dehydro-3-deoxyheptonate aldolase [Halorubrum lacusprofundi ATCC 49239]
MLPHADDAISRDGKSLILAYDHGLEHGPVDFDPNPSTADPERLFELASHDAVTALAVQKGIAEAYYPDYEEDVNLLLKLNGTSSLWMGEPDSPVNCSAEYAADLGADAIGFTLYGGSNHEVEMAEEFKAAQEGAREHDMGVVMWSYPRGQGVKNDTSPDTISYAARLGLELGADVVKVKYPGSAEAMGEAVRMAGPTKVVMSGGTMRDDKAFLRNVADAIDAGATGLAVGRNVFQRDDPERILDALEAVVFEEVELDEAIAIADDD